MKGQLDEKGLQNLLARRPLAEGPPVYTVDPSVWPRCDAEASPRRGYYYHLEKDMRRFFEQDAGERDAALSGGVWNRGALEIVSSSALGWVVVASIVTALALAFVFGYSLMFKFPPDFRLAFASGLAKAPRESVCRTGAWAGIHYEDDRSGAVFRRNVMAQISTRNRLPGTITEVVKDEVSAKVSMQVGDNHLVSVITRESADELDLREGQRVMAMVKATDVMVMTEEGEIA